MNDIETLLKGVLPEKKKLTLKVKNRGIHKLVDGKYIAENVYLVEKKIDVEEIHFCNKIEKLKIHPLISEYSKIKSPHLENLVFIDTETTGLAGGAGTYIFLIGIGYIRDQKVILKQFFLTDLSSEKDLIGKLLESINKESVYVSYNGKSYDVPLINSRSVFHKCSGKLNKFNNIDLLHISRRFWKDLLDNYSLQSIEQSVLRSVRSGAEDIPGSAIPDAYFDYLQTKNAETMKNVIYHNRIDILSMLVLFEKVNNILFSKDITSVNATEIGRLFQQTDMIEEAIEVFTKLIDNDPKDLLAIKELSFIFKRNNDLTKAAELWLQAAELNEKYAFIELAKLEEHINHNFKEALNWTDRALEVFYEDENFNNEDVHELKYRKNRLVKLIEESK